MTTPQLGALIRKVGTRELIASYGASLRLAVLIAAGLALLLICAVRLLALLPTSALSVPVLAALLALAVVVPLLVRRRKTTRELARLIDERSGSRELFLSAASVTGTPGAFQPVVNAQAEAKAGELSATQIVPFRWQRGVRDGALAAAVVAAAVLFLPQLDPFKKEVARQKISQQQQRLVETKKATEIRKEQLAIERTESAEQIQKALAQLDKTFKEAKPLEKEANLKRLGEQQKELGELWKKVSNEQLRNSADKATQSFGQADLKKLEQWREELKKGDLSSLKKELQQIREQMKELAAQPDSPEKRAQQELLAQRLNEAAQGLKQLANSPQVSQALQRTLEQMDLSKLGDLSKDGMQAAMDSLNLSEQELQQLADAFKEGQQLDEALKNLQMARQLANADKLDGAECAPCKSMSDYAALFAAKCAGLIPGEGGAGMGPGIGNGALRPENESAVTDFKQEKSRSQLTGGKLLLEWKTSEVGETGARTEEYQNALQQVKSGVSEAIQQEQVPPGYHDTIKRYFDALPEQQPAPAKALR
ncbi:MAG TPA: hypothetical protein VF593_11675 [Chthoniobacteraceae bacterium]|jgi:hypothetical protein